MGDHPTLYELEQAILCYTSPSTKSGLQEWQAMKWLWERLSLSARFVSHFGVSTASWWKERYIFPLLCQESVPYLQRFLNGDWTRAEEESLRYCFHFFVPYAAKSPTLFPVEIACSYLEHGGKERHHESRRQCPRLEFPDVVLTR